MYSCCVRRWKPTNPSPARYLEKQVYHADRSLLLADKKEVQVLNAQVWVAPECVWYSPTQAAKPWQHPQQIAVVGCRVLAELKIIVLLQKTACAGSDWLNYWILVRRNLPM